MFRARSSPLPERDAPSVGRIGHLSRVLGPVVAGLTVMAGLTLTACEDRTPSPQRSDPSTGVTAVAAVPNEYYTTLFEAAIEEALDRRAARSFPDRPTVVLDVPYTKDAYGDAGDGPTLGHVREAFSRFATRRERMTWVEGSMSAEVTCVETEGYPRRSCTMDARTLLLRLTPQRPEFRLGLPNGDYTVDVETREQAIGAGRLIDEIHQMTFRHVDGRWQLVAYGLGQA